MAQLAMNLSNTCDFCGDRLDRDEKEVSLILPGGVWEYHGECWDSGSADHPENVVRAVQAAQNR